MMANHKVAVRSNVANRYQLWSERLQIVSRLCRAAEGSRGFERGAINLRVKRACEDMDKLVVPSGWRSWEDIGRAVAAQPRLANKD